MNEQNSGGVSRFAGSFMSPCAPIQTEMNNCLVNARKQELREKNREQSKKLREKYKEFKNVEVNKAEGDGDKIEVNESVSEKLNNSEINKLGVQQPEIEINKSENNGATIGNNRTSSPPIEHI